ncbi:MAG: efflux RND transporter permease subunit, partial [Bacteroidales bacterium]|nr:efflux RND transporter permease subunit [Bacteroidales bacterium]
GAEAVGGVVVARYGANPLEAINNVKDKIAEISPGLPSRTLEDGTVSKVTIVPFYDRTGLIKETLGTLESALTEEVIISIIVVIILMLSLQASFLISSLLPIGVLMTFIAMRHFGVDANVVALSGIAIAIGVMVDVGVVFTENIARHLDMPGNKGVRGRKLLLVIYEGTTEVASAVITALLTTVVSFLPVFAMQAAEGKLFRPLAFTKTFAMISALIIGLMIIPTLANLVFSIRFEKKRIKRMFNFILIAAGIIFIIVFKTWLGIVLIALGVNGLLEYRWPENKKKFVNYINIALTLLVVLYFLSIEWMPLGAQRSLFLNILFVVSIVVVVLGILMSIVRYYKPILRWCLDNKWKFLGIPIGIVLLGIIIWQGVDKVFGFLPEGVRQTRVWQSAENTFPGIGKEFMPSLDEGSFLLMPTTMPHSGIEENIEVIAMLDKMVNVIPEVENVVGKWGRVNSALDPAPTSMYENLINYKPEYILDENGHRMRFKVNRKDAFVLADGSIYHPVQEGFRLISKEDLIPDKNGKYFRQWRDHIQSTDDIWKEILSAAKIPGLTSAPKLQPIQTRLIMLQTGMRAPMGIKVFGPDLESIEKTGFELE